MRPTWLPYLTALDLPAPISLPPISLRLILRRPIYLT